MAFFLMLSNGYVIDATGAECAPMAARKAAPAGRGRAMRDSFPQCVPFKTRREVAAFIRGVTPDLKDDAPELLAAIRAAEVVPA